MAKGTCSVVEHGERCEREAKSRGFCQKHYMRWWMHGDPLIVLPPHKPRAGEVAPRFWAKVDRGGPVPEHRPDLGPCWIWTAGLNSTGYGQFNVTARKPRTAHLVAFELAVGPIPEGMQLDHLCHNNSGCPGGRNCPHRPCVNPAHLEPVLAAENKRRGMSPAAINARKTHCIHGHEFTPENTYRDLEGERHCRECRRVSGRRTYARHKGRA